MGRERELGRRESAASSEGAKNIWVNRLLTKHGFLYVDLHCQADSGVSDIEIEPQSLGTT